MMTGSTDAQPRASRRIRLLVSGEVLLSLVLGFVDIGSKPLWQDEGFSAMMSTGSWRQVVDVVQHRDPNMSGYDVIIRFWGYVGSSETALRSLSVLAVAAAVPFMFLLARRLFDERTGLVAGLVFVTAPFVVHYQQEVRSYGLVLLCAITASVCFVRSLDSNDRRFWLSFAVLGALGIYLHFFGVFLVVAQGLSLLLLPRRALAGRRFGRAFLVLGLLSVPAVLLFAFGPRTQVSWIKFSRAVATTETRTLAGGHVLLVTHAVCMVVALAIVVKALRAAGRSDRAFAFGFPAVWALLPILASLGYSIAAKPFYVARYLIAALPALVLVTAAVVALIRWAWLFFAALLVIVVASGQQIRNWYQKGQIEDWPSAVAAVTAGARPSDGIVFCNPGFRPVFEYYIDREPTRSRPTPLSPSEPWGEGVHVDGAWPPEVQASRAERVWVITGPGYSDEPVCGAARAGRDQAADFRFRGVDVQRWDEDRSSN